MTFFLLKSMMCSFPNACDSALPALQIGFLVAFLHAESNVPSGRNMNLAAVRVKRREAALDAMSSPAASCRLQP
jgi:glycerol uptake facilitator-like aquaporin